VQEQHHRPAVVVVGRAVAGSLARVVPAAARAARVALAAVVVAAEG
jgi:hypothetical protein